MHERNAKVYVCVIIEATDRIDQYLSGLTFEEFSKDNKTVDAVIRNFAVIGEAAKHIPLEVRRKNLKIAWKRMAGMRDKVVHVYFGVDTNILWDASKNDLPTQKPLLKELLKEL